MSPYSHFYDESSNEYYININSLNCVLEIEFLEKKYINREIRLFFYEKDIKKNKLKIKLYELDSKSKNKNEYCIYYIMSNSIAYQKNTIIINEGVVHTMTLDEKIETITYRYPYAFDDNIVSISLYKYLKDDLDIYVNINGVYTQNSFTMKNMFFKKIVIYVNTLKEVCLKDSEIVPNYKDFINICPININVRLSNKIQNNKQKRMNKFQIEVLSNGKTPTYIRNGEIRFDSFIVNQYSSSGGKSKNNYVYYYSDIGKDEYPSEIIINNKFGSCEAVAKIISKNNVDMFSNWDRRVKLPTYDDNDKENYIKYDYELSKFIIKKKDLEKCEQGCEIYVGVFSRETSVYFQINDFMIIFYKNYKNEPINLIFNQNIDDSITKKINNKYYISHLEDENTNKLVFTFNSDYCSLCIIMIDNNDDYDIKKMSKCDWKLDNIVNGYKNYMLNIKSNDIKLKGKDLTSIKFISKISSQIRNNNDNLFYSLKINKQVNNLPMIINVDSINNEIAQIDIETGLAYYAIRIQEYQIINEIDLLVISEEKVINDNIYLYGKIISQDEYNKENFNEELFNEDYNNYTIKSDNELPNHLKIQIFHNRDKEEDKIIFLVVKCNSINKVDTLMNHYVKILVAFYKPNTNNSLKNNNLKLYNIEHQSPKFFIPITKNKYSIVVINCFKGVGEITIDTLNNNYINDNDENKFIDINCDNNKEYKFVLDLNKFHYSYDVNEEKFSAIKIKNKNYSISLQNTFLFYISYFNKYIRNNIESIDLNKDNKIYYPIINNIKNHKSLSYYSNINDIDNDDLLVEISFNNKYVKDENNLNILSALINDEFIYENMINEQQIIFSPLYGKNYYNKNNKNIYIYFKNNDIKKYKSNFGYALFSISNNYFNYDIYINENENDKNDYLYAQIKLIKNGNDLLNDCIEIINRYSNKIENIDKNDNNNSNKDSTNKSFFCKIVIFVIILIILVVLFIVFRWFRRKNIQSIDYVNNMTPILK